MIFKIEHEDIDRDIKIEAKSEIDAASKLPQALKPKEQDKFQSDMEMGFQIDLRRVDNGN